MGDDTDKLIVLGVITGVHGIKGEVKIKSFTADPASIGDYGPLLMGDSNKPVNFTRIRAHKNGFVASIKGINDRNSAEALKGSELKVERSVLPEAEDGEFYYNDLIGLRVTSTKGADLGLVLAVHNFGAGDLLEIGKSLKDKTELVQFNQQTVPEVDIDGGVIVVDLPEFTDDE